MQWFDVPLERGAAPPPPTPARAIDDGRPLTANEIHSRFGDYGLEARYRRQQQERNPRDYGELSRPVTASDHAVRGNTPAEKVGEVVATREKQEKFTRESQGEKFTRAHRENFTRAAQGRDGGRDRSGDGRGDR